MFDVGFSELLVIGVVALVVIGPERLPGVARTAGVLLGRLQRYVNGVKADINREIHLDELKKLQQQVAEEARSVETAVHSEMQAVENSLQELEQPAGPQPELAPVTPLPAPAAALALADAPVPSAGADVSTAPPTVDLTAQQVNPVQLELGLGAGDDKKGSA